MPMTGRVRLTAVALCVLAVVAGCGSSTPTEAADTAASGLRVASFDFGESTLLAELYAQVVEESGVPVIRLGPIGPREIIAPAMELDRIDLVPESLGTALQYAGSAEANPDTSSAWADLAERLAGRGLTALEPSPAEDKNVFVVTNEAARREGLANITDLSSVGQEQRFGGPPECPDRPLCLLGLERVYGLHFAEFVPQRSLASTAEALRRGEIDVGLMFSTASELEAGDLVELIDDHQMQPAENVVPVIRIDAIERWGPELVVALDALSQRLTTGDLRTLNNRLADGEPIEEVARSWLQVRGLVASD